MFLVNVIFKVFCQNETSSSRTGLVGSRSPGFLACGPMGLLSEAAPAGCFLELVAVLADVPRKHAEYPLAGQAWWAVDLLCFLLAPSMGLLSEAAPAGRFLEMVAGLADGGLTGDLCLLELSVGCIVVLLFYVHGKHLRSCRDGQLT